MDPDHFGRIADPHVRNLIAWAEGAFRAWALGGNAEVPVWLAAYGRLLHLAWGAGPPRPVEPTRTRLASPFEVIPRPGDAQTATLDPAPLHVHYPPANASTTRPTDPAALFESFSLELESLGGVAADLETFGHLFRDYAWAVPCTYGEAGVSLYEEFKALAALLHASRFSHQPASRYLLVGGDLPGIQGFVYTITSRGAAKALRGRSFFLQILSDALVRSLVERLGLCWANVVYAAGGNFQVLAPADSADEILAWEAEVNSTLLTHFRGDLYLTLAAQPCAAGELRAPGFSQVRERLGAQVAQAKHHAFRDLLRAGERGALFEPQGQGGLESCNVCQRDPDPGEAFTDDKCPLCASLEKLARDIAHDDLWMIVDRESPSEGTWQEVLHAVSGFRYRFFGRRRPQAGRDERVYRVNAVEVAGSNWGYRFIANVTPRVRASDKSWFVQHYPDEPAPDVDDVKDFQLMARQAVGIERVGVLRMDVDDLGAIFGDRFRGSLPQLSALSAAMDLFFCGHLNRLCREVEPDPQPKTVYTIYAGGDDLFIVGAWDRMPELAHRIREGFRAYTFQHPGFTISGGVTLEGAHFPLYRAAERSEDAEKAAKKHKHPDGRSKDAFCFLGTAFGWEEWDTVAGQRDNLLWLIGEDKEAHCQPDVREQGRLARSVLQTVQGVHAQYLRDGGDPAVSTHPGGHAPLGSRLVYGRWQWMHEYALTRLARGSRSEEVKDRLRRLQVTLLTLETVYLSGLAARWAELLTRRRG